MAQSSGLEAAIKELLTEELKELRDEIGKQEQRYEELGKTCQDLSGKLVEREREAETLRLSLEKCREDIETAAGKSQAQVAEDVATMKSRLDRFEDDAEGMGGLKQLLDKTNNLERILSDMTPKLDESMRVVKDNTTRTEAFDRKLVELSRQCEENVQLLKSCDERVTNMEGISSTVSVAQEALEDSVTRKYEKLWEDVLHAIEEVKGSQLKVVQEDLENQTSAAKAETRSLVNYALNFMASAHGERRQMSVNKSLLLAWKDQTWNSSRRRLGVTYLRNILQRRERIAFGELRRATETQGLCKRLHNQYEGQLGDVYKRIDDNACQFRSHCSKLDVSVNSLEDQKSSKINLRECAQELRAAMDELKTKTIDPMSATLKEHHAINERHSQLHRNHTDQESNLDTKITGVSGNLADVNERCNTLAKIEDVDNMVRDVLMIWNSIKQLDTSKADKKDVDSFALETGNRDKLSVRRIEDLEADVTMRSKQDTLRLEEKCSELEGRLDESGRQFRHWEQMWEKLSGFVEDLVSKIGDLQADNKPSLATLRAAGRPSSRDPLSRSRAEIPTLPTNGLDSSVSTALRQGQVHDGFDSKMLWINSAKGIVDATIDQAVNVPTPHSGRSRVLKRPTSASGTRTKQHDRAR